MTCSLGARHSPWEFNGINSELQHCREWIRFWKFVLFADRCVDSGHRKQRGDNRGAPRRRNLPNCTIKLVNTVLI